MSQKAAEWVNANQEWWKTRCCTFATQGQSNALSVNWTIRLALDRKNNNKDCVCRRWRISKGLVDKASDKTQELGCAEWESGSRLRSQKSHIAKWDNSWHLILLFSPLKCERKQKYWREKIGSRHNSNRPKKAGANVGKTERKNHGLNWELSCFLCLVLRHFCLWFWRLKKIS